MTQVDVLHVRVRLLWTEAKTKDDKLDNQITVDLAINRMTRLPVGKHPVFGIYGSPLRAEVYPFILQVDGTLDYGGNAGTGSDRFDSLNLLDRKVAIGELCTYESTQEEVCYRVESVVDPATGNMC